MIISKSHQATYLKQQTPLLKLFTSEAKTSLAQIFLNDSIVLVSSIN